MSTFVLIHGAAHGGSMFYDEERLALVKNFLKKGGLSIPSMTTRSWFRASEPPPPPNMPGNIW